MVSYFRKNRGNQSFTYAIIHLRWVAQEKEGGVGVDMREFPKAAKYETRQRLTKTSVNVMQVG
jgi:hypothetical protein